MKVSPGARPLMGGARAAVPFAVPVFAFGVSLGVLAKGAGYPFAATVLMSSLTFVGSSQFATVSVMAGGGGLLMAVLAGALLNLRYLVMGFAIAPALRGGRLRRARDSQLVIEESWAIAATPGGGFDYARLMGSGLVLWAAWSLGTAIGAAGPFSGADLERFGFDAISPALFFLLLTSHLEIGEQRAVAAAGGLLSIGFLATGLVNWSIFGVCAAALWWSWRRP
ncbi:AzlC family ABC transporter permease [Nonomuraea rubra]